MHNAQFIIGQILMQDVLSIVSQNFVTIVTAQTIMNYEL